MTLRNRPFGPVLALLLAAAAVLRGLLLREHLAESPFAFFPYSDGQLYWELAGEMASGSWLGSDPFLIAPLYPFLLAALRWLGVGLAGVAGLQLLLHLATAGLVADATRRRFGPTAGLLAAGLFLLLDEPALFATRVLSVTLQLLLAALLWWDWSRLAAAASPTRLQVARVGALTGLLALAFPAALLLLPVLVAWLLATAPDRSSAWRRALAGSGASLLVIAPASLHNAQCSGELIPITAHAGITLAQGNSPRSVGIYTPLPGVGTDIHQQHRDAARSFEQSVGRPGSWGEIDAFFRSRVVAWWLDRPGEALALVGRKLLWLASARRYDNVAVFALEREQGLVRSAAALPLALPWLWGAGLLGALLALREPRRAVPELALVGLPVLVCVVFYYSARYRLLAAPGLCALAAVAAVRWRELPLPRGAAAAVALSPLALLLWSETTGFERLDFMRAAHAKTLAHHHMLSGARREARGEAAAAALHYRRAAAADPTHADARRHLYNLHAARGELEPAAAALEELVAVDPGDAAAHLTLAWLRAAADAPRVRDPEAALYHARQALRYSGEQDAEAWLVLAVAEAAAGRFERAQEAADRARERAAATGDDTLLANLAGLAAHLEARRAVTSAPRRLTVARL